MDRSTRWLVMLAALGPILGLAAAPRPAQAQRSLRQVLESFPAINSADQCGDGACDHDVEARVFGTLFAVYGSSGHSSEAVRDADCRPGRKPGACSALPADSIS
ncbi:MAG TPA: hypothetical protein VKA44_04520 [Gemmatimonadota bacterium]|nr:hypothetical protein [Gemmatimonadota bacterium]